jgi:hypothetical protein
MTMPAERCRRDRSRNLPALPPDQGSPVTRLPAAPCAPCSGTPACRSETPLCGCRAECKDIVNLLDV